MMWKASFASACEKERRKTESKQDRSEEKGESKL